MCKIWYPTKKDQRWRVVSDVKESEEVLKSEPFVPRYSPQPDFVPWSDLFFLVVVICTAIVTGNETSSLRCVLLASRLPDYTENNMLIEFLRNENIF